MAAPRAAPRAAALLHSCSPSHRLRRGLPLLMLSALLLGGCKDNDPAVPPPAPTVSGQDVFRFETFGNERFWTDAMQLPQGIAGAGVTPLVALSLGLNVNVQALSPATAQAVLDALAQVEAGTPAEDTVLGNPAVTLALINEGAVVGVVPFAADGRRKPLGSDTAFRAGDTLDLARGDKVGVSCALCHARTDDSVVPAGFVGPGSVGAEIDGITAEGLDVGAIFATAANPLAYLPFLQLSFDSLDGASLGRGGFTGIRSSDSIEAQTAAARAYLTGVNGLTGKRHYPLTSFDSTPDGIGNASYTPPFFRTDLAAPWGSSGAFENLDDFNNLVYTIALDPTALLTTKGRTLLNVLAGPVGDEIASRYESVLRATGVIPTGAAVNDVVPYVRVARTDLDAGSSAGLAGRRVEEAKLQALKAYTNALPSPAAPDGLDPAAVARGEMLFNTASSEGGAGCTGCHRDPGVAVENDRIRPITAVYRAYQPDLVLLDRSAVGLSNIQKTTSGPAPDYDLSLVVLDATRRLAENPPDSPLVDGRTPVQRFVRGYSKPLLLALASKAEFLHDGSVIAPEGYLPDSRNASLDWLMNPAREAPEVVAPEQRAAPHAFYYPQVGATDDPAGRDALVQYLLSRTAR